MFKDKQVACNAVIGLAACLLYSLQHDISKLERVVLFLQFFICYVLGMHTVIARFVKLDREFKNFVEVANRRYKELHELKVAKEAKDV